MSRVNAGFIGAANCLFFVDFVLSPCLSKSCSRRLAYLFVAVRLFFLAAGKSVGVVLRSLGIPVGALFLLSFLSFDFLSPFVVVELSFVVFDVEGGGTSDVDEEEFGLIRFATLVNDLFRVFDLLRFEVGGLLLLPSPLLLVGDAAAAASIFFLLRTILLLLVFCGSALGDDMELEVVVRSRPTRDGGRPSTRSVAIG